jgi:hypothetical protein
MAGELKGCTIAVLATDGVEQVELTEPVKALKEAGAEVRVVSNKDDEIQAFKHHDKGKKIPVDESLEDAEPAKFDGLVLPGGVINPDALRLVPQAIEFVRHFVEVPRPVDSDRCRWREGQKDDVLAVAQNRPVECRRQMGRRAGSRRWRACHLAQARRHSGVQ